MLATQPISGIALDATGPGAGRGGLHAAPCRPSLQAATSRSSLNIKGRQRLSPSATPGEVPSSRPDSGAVLATPPNGTASAAVPHRRPVRPEWSPQKTAEPEAGSDAAVRQYRQEPGAGGTWSGGASATSDSSRNSSREASEANAQKRGRPKKSWPKVLGGRKFKRPEELFQFFSIMLTSATKGVPLPPQDEAALLDLVTLAHPRAEEKLGVGLDYVAVEKHPDYTEVHCFVLHRTDGSAANFSYRKCLNALLGREWATNVPPLVRLQQLSHKMARTFRCRTYVDPELSVEVFPEPAASAPSCERVNQFSGYKLTDFIAAREALIDDIFKLTEHLGSHLTGRCAYMAMNALANCVQDDSSRATAVVQDERFLTIEARVRPAHLKAMTAERQGTFLATLLWTISVLKYVPRNGMLEQASKLLLSALPQLSSRHTARISRCYMELAEVFLPPPAVLTAVAARMAALVAQDKAPPSDVANVVFSQAMVGVLGLQHAEVFVQRLHRNRQFCTRTELSMVLLALGKLPPEARPERTPHYASGFLGTLLSKMESTKHLSEAAAAGIATEARPHFATPLRRALQGLQLLCHQPTPSQTAHLCSLLDAHCSALQAPHDVLQALAALGVTRPASAQHGERFLGALLEGCRPRMLDPGRWGDAPITAAWALAVMQECDVPGYREVWQAACAAVTPSDDSKALKLFHTAMIHSIQQVPGLEGIQPQPHIAHWAQRLWLASTAQRPISQMARQVATALRALGLEYVAEYLTEDGLFSIDLALRPPPSGGARPASRAGSVASSSHGSRDGGGSDVGGGGGDALARDLRPQPARLSDGGVTTRADTASAARFAAAEPAAPGAASATSRSGFSLLAPGARLKGDQQDGAAGSDLSALLHSSAVADTPPGATDNDRAWHVTGRKPSWQTELVAGLGLHLEAELDTAGLPRIAIEVDGPHHFATNNLEPLGRTLVRDRLLSARGWLVVSVPHYEWEEVHVNRRAEYLALRLQAAGIALERFLPDGTAAADFGTLRQKAETAATT